MDAVNAFMDSLGLFGYNDATTEENETTLIAEAHNDDGEAYPPEEAPPVECSDTANGATDPYGDGCEWYDHNTYGCGFYDSDSF